MSTLPFQRKTGLPFCEMNSGQGSTGIWLKYCAPSNAKIPAWVGSQITCTWFARCREHWRLLAEAGIDFDERYLWD